MLTASSSFTGYYWGESDSIFFILFRWVFIHIYKTHLIFLFFRWNSSSSPSLSLCKSCCSALCLCSAIRLTPGYSMWPRPGPSICIPSAEQGEKISPLGLLAVLFPKQPRIPLAFLSPGAHIWLTISLFPFRPPAHFLTSCSPVCGPTVWQSRVCPACTQTYPSLSFHH